MSSPQKWKAVIIGCGSIAGGYDERLGGDTVMTHAKAYVENPRVELGAAFDPNPKRLQEFAAYWHVPKVYSTMGALLEETRPDIVSICSPNETHYPILQEVAQTRPKAIICEKPLALDFDQASEMLEICRRQSIQLLVNYMRRWDPTLLALGARIRKGDFGRLQNVRTYYTKGVFHNASHSINLLQSWLGPVCDTRVFSARPWQKMDLSASFYLSFAECKDVVFQGCDADNFNFFEIEMIFSQARILLPGGGNSIVITPRESSPLMPGVYGLAKKPEIISGTLPRALQFVIEDLVSVLDKKQALKMPPEEALETTRICAEIRKKGEKLWQN